MPEESGLCRACCHVVMATEGPHRIVGMASAVISGGVLSIFYFNVCADFRKMGLRAELLSRLEAWGRARRERPAQMVSGRRDKVYAKSLESMLAMVRKKRSPSAWKKSGVCIQELELERPEIAFDDCDRPIGERLRRSDGSPRGMVLPFNGGLPGGDGLPAGGVPPGGGGEGGFLRSKDIAAMENGDLRPVVYYAVTARTSEGLAGLASGVFAYDIFLVWDLEVRREHRGRGLGTELLGRLEVLGRKLGAEEAWRHPGAEELEPFMRKRGYCFSEPVCKKIFEKPG